MSTSPSPNSLTPPLTPQEEVERQAEAERMQEVTLLMTNLFDREEATIKAIFRCLYDVGSINFINRRIQIRPLRSLAKPVTRLVQPVCIFMGYRWFQKQCPPMIVGWLQGKVQFKPKRMPPKQTYSAPKPASVEILPTQADLVEIRRLRSQVNWTRGALVGVSAMLVLALLGFDLKTVEQLWQTTLSGQSVLGVPPSSPAKQREAIHR
ncbi:MAG: hypothetical protein WCD18_28370 [Thermosynechococcaceae cyanobacterium]